MDQENLMLWILLIVLSLSGSVEAFGSKETLLASVFGGFVLLVALVIVYHCYLKRQQLKTPYNDELLGKDPEICQQQET